VYVAAKRDRAAAKAFFRQALATAGAAPSEIVTDRAPVYPKLIEELFPAAWHHREQYANNRLEQVADDRQAEWISQLAPDNRAYAERRASELRTLRQAREGALSATEIAEEIDYWTDWLQIRLANALADRDALAMLCAKGRTRRIRNNAAARLGLFSR